MEKRVLLAFLLSLLLISVYWYFVPPPGPRDEKTQPQVATDAPPVVTSSSPASSEKTSLRTDSPPQDKAIAAEIIKGSTDLYEIEFTTNMGMLSSLKLKDYLHSLDNPLILYKRIWNQISGKKPPPSDYDENKLVDMVEAVADQERGILAFLAISPDESLIYHASDWEFDGDLSRISFSADLSENLSIVKTYQFNDKSYEFLLKVELSNHGSESILINPILKVGSGNEIIEASYNPKHKVAMSLINDDYEKYDSDETLKLQNFRWLAIADVYFATGIKVDGGGWLAELTPEDVYINGRRQLNPSLTLSHNPLSLGSQSTWQQSYNLYMGPKDVGLLKKFDETFTETLDLFFNIIARPMLHVLRWFHQYVGNWGISIMLLTISVRLIMFPLAFKGMKGMKNMSRATPRIKSLRKKYSADKQRLNEEIMKLYRKNKINPVTGCLPMIAQIPIFIALYWALLPAVELRHQPFFLWINDLSYYDPYMILPILMGVTMFVQQKIAPPPANLEPMQQKIMNFLPVMMTLFFINFPAGLVLYWVTSNFITIGQQFIFNRIKVKELID